MKNFDSVTQDAVMSSDSDVKPPRILSPDEVRRRLKKYWSALCRLPHRAFEKYKRHIATKMSQPSGRLRSTAIQDFMIDEMRLTFGEDMFRGRHRWLLRASPDLVVQFKKVNSAGKTRNYPTNAAREFETQLEFPDMPRGMRATLGYRLNGTNTEVANVWMIARDGDRIIWRDEVTNQTQVDMAETTPIFGAPAASTAKKSRSTPRLRPTKEAAAARRNTKKNKKGPNHGG